MSNNLTITENPNILWQFRGKALWTALATLIDGEGYIGLVLDNRGIFHPQIVVLSICNMWMVMWQMRLSRGRLYPQKATVENTKDGTRWTMTKRADIVYILKRIHSYLIVKRKQAELLIDFYEGKPVKGTWLGEQELARRMEIYNRMRELNAKGIRRDHTLDDQQMLVDDMVRTVETPTELDANVLVQ